MRPYIAALVFAFATLAAACSGGGGSSGIVPHSGTSTNTPQYGGASLSLKIPPQPRSGSLRHAAYVSPNTQSVQIFVYQLASPSASPSPQTFPVATPVPCTQAADGSKTCTFNAEAPFGMDQFVIKTYATASPDASAIPLAVFQTGAINVAPGSAPTPISLSLTGVVSSVSVAMESPEPSITQSTQIWTAAAPLPPATLSITPHDSSGANIVTDTFDSPISVTLSPSNAGVSIALGASQCSPASSISGTTVTITCAKDLGKVTYAYDGTVARDSLKNVVDHYTFSGQPQNTSSPQPAVLALTGTMIPVTLPNAGVVNAFPLQFVRRNNGTFYYLAGSSPKSEFGTFDPSGSMPSRSAAVSFVAAGIAVDNSGDVWIGVNNNGSGNSLQCFTSISQTAANAVSLPNGVAPFALATDANGNVWYYGMDVNHTSWAGYFVPPAGCGSPVSFPSPGPAQFSTIGDYPQTMIADPNGSVWLLSNSNGNIYNLTTSSLGGIISNPIPAPGSYFGEALAIDGAGDLYSSLPPNATLAPVLGALPSGSSNVSAISLEPGATVGGLDVYPTTGAATRLAYADGLGLATLDVSAGIATSNLQIAPITRSGFYATTFFDANGDSWMAYTDANGNPALIHLIRTSVWTIANTSLSAPTTGGAANVAISETGDSGPFTVSKISDPTVATALAPSQSIDHLLPVQISPNASTSPIPLTITVKDARGRLQTRTFSVSHYVPGARRRNSAKIPSRSRSPH